MPQEARPFGSEICRLQQSQFGRIEIARNRDRQLIEARQVLQSRSRHIGSGKNQRSVGSEIGQRCQFASRHWSSELNATTRNTDAGDAQSLRDEQCKVKVVELYEARWQRFILIDQHLRITQPTRVVAVFIRMADRDVSA